MDWQIDKSLSVVVIAAQRLEADESEDYLNTEWADPTGLKKTFTGAGDISWRPK